MQSAPEVVQGQLLAISNGDGRNFPPAFIQHVQRLGYCFPGIPFIGHRRGMAKHERLATFDNHPTAFTAVPHDAGINSRDVLEIVALRVGGLKTFWTIAIGQIIGVNGQMAMPTPHPVALCWQEHELAMCA
jgi:hypothetical protein